MRVLLLLLLINIVLADKWAVLVAGSNEYYNYRHQADICHAYQIFHENGYPDSNIIVMMYDDIAYSESNPFPGVIINRPGGNNLYDGVPKDYTQKDVTPANFLKVLNGTASGKVVVPNPDNDIFIYFADHGAPGLIAFPYAELYAHQLNNAFINMFNNNMYHSIVIYVEACESGSMFNNKLNSSMNIYAVTAATPRESSYACYYDPILQTYLGDVFSVNWLNNADDFETVANETLLDEFKIVSSETNTSQVCAYGNLTMDQMKLSDYLFFNESLVSNKIRQKHIITDVINSRNVKMEFLEKSMRAGTTNQNIIAEYLREKFHENILQNLYGIPNEDLADTCYPKEEIDTYCLEKKINQFKEKYGQLTDAALKYIRQIGKECFNK